MVPSSALAIARFMPVMVSAKRSCCAAMTTEGGTCDHESLLVLQQTQRMLKHHYRTGAGQGSVAECFLRYESTLMSDIIGV